MNGATISECGRYRYALSRRLSDSAIAPAEALFVMLNPSTADACVDDATIRRCKGFALRFGCSHLLVANLYAWRATNPRDLWAAPDPIGPENDAVIAALAERASLIVCAWGQTGPDKHRPAAVIDLLSDYPCLALGFTKHGQPRHPLYLPKDAPLVSLEKLS